MPRAGSTSCAATRRTWTSTSSSPSRRPRTIRCSTCSTRTRGSAAWSARRADACGMPADVEAGLGALERLTETEDAELMTLLAAWPETLEGAALAREPHRVTGYLRELANGLQRYYTLHKVLVDDAPLQERALRAAVRGAPGAGQRARPDRRVRPGGHVAWRRSRPRPTPARSCSRSACWSGSCSASSCCCRGCRRTPRSPTTRRSEADVARAPRRLRVLHAARAGAGGRDRDGAAGGARAGAGHPAGHARGAGQRAGDRRQEPRRRELRRDSRPRASARSPGTCRRATSASPARRSGRARRCCCWGSRRSS